MTERVKKAIDFLKSCGATMYDGIYDTRNIAGDLMETIYNQDGIVIDDALEWGYIEVFGTTPEEFKDIENALYTEWCDCEIECVHSGQYHPYGDTHRVFAINTRLQLTDAQILYIMNDKYGYDVPLKKDWNSHDCMSYFRGYCEITKTDFGYKYDKVEPYDD